MKNALVIQHVDFEGLGHIKPWLVQHGYRITTYHPPGDAVWTINMAHVDLLVILGGPMSVNDRDRLAFIDDEIHLVETALETAVPTLGICLGAQVLAVAAGGTVRPMPMLEIGLAPVQLTDQGKQTALRHLAADQPVLHWHGEAIDLPPNGVCLARTNACNVQAFAIGPRMLGLQFHLETDLKCISDWTQGHASDVSAAGANPDLLIAEAHQYADAAANACSQVIEEWLKSL